MKISSRQFHAPQRRPARRGMVLITVMWIGIALAAVVLVLCREMQVEQLTARQHLSQAKADAAELGVEQYVMSVVEQEMLTPGYKDTISWQQHQLGDCYFWVLTPNLDDETQPAFGLTDEAGKLDINYATEDQLEQLPNLDPSIACSIVDWRDFDDTVTVSQSTGATGEESDFYDSTYGYRAKNANFENLDELRMVAGLTPSDEPNASMYLYGSDTNHDAVIEPNEQSASNAGMNFQTTMRGIMPYITVWGYQATNPPILAVSNAPNAAGTGTVTTTITPLTTIAVTMTSNGTTTTRTVATTATNTSFNNQPYDAVPQVLTDVSSLVPIDVNNAAEQTLLQQLLQQAAPSDASAAMTQVRQRVTAAAGGGGGGKKPATTTAKPFTNIWDFIVNSGLNSTDLSSENTPSGEPLFCVLTCLQASVTEMIDPATGMDATTELPLAPVQFAGLNMNTASEQAIMCLTGTNSTSNNGATIATAQTQPAGGQQPQWVPAFTQEDAENIITYREQNIASIISQDPLQAPNISWLLDVLDPTEYPQLVAAGNEITGWSTTFSADIVTVTQDGRAFKRVKVVVDVSSGTAVVVYRRDNSDAGWPLDPTIRTRLRNGEQLPTISPTGNTMLGIH